jgi:predicted nucleotidyltransferase
MFVKTTSQVKRLRHLANKAFVKGEEQLAFSILATAREIMSKTIQGQLPPSSILASVANLCLDNGIDFAVIGGVALTVHGQIRATEDVDLLVSHLPPKYRLQDAEYMARFGFYKTRSSTGTVLTIDSRASHGYVELLVADTDLKQWALATSSIENVLRESVPVVSAEALVALKIHAANENKKRQAKDLPDALSIILKSKPDIELIKDHLMLAESMLLDTILKKE